VLLLALPARAAPNATVAELAKKLEGPWKSTDEERRAVLTGFGAQVPDAAAGIFKPRRGRRRVRPRPTRSG
jgi:hypothetical protein